MIATATRLALAPSGPIDAVVHAPGSKSITNRALLVAALAEGESTLEGALEAEDATVMADALRALGAGIERVPAASSRAGAVTLRVVGRGGAWREGPLDLDVRLSGTAVRFLAAAVALGHGRYRLDGTARMRERPIQDQLDALAELGVPAVSELGTGCPPVVVDARGIAGGRAEVHGERSSQFLSGLLMSAPYARASVELIVRGELRSAPFVDMTLAVMEAFGVDVERDRDLTRFVVRPGAYAPRRYRIEADAMAAGYFWAVAAATGGRVRTPGIGRGTVQGDARFADVLRRMGCTVTWRADEVEVVGPPGGALRGGRFDLHDLPDQAQTLAALALFADDRVEVERVPNLRIKETDRLRALAVELGRFGARVVERDDGLTIDPPPRPAAAVEVATYGDHRMAMAFAVVGARQPGVTIADPRCVEKTYPRFFDDLAAVGVGVAPA